MLTFAMAAVVLGACGERMYFDTREAGVPVVDGILIVDAPLPALFLRRAVAADIATSAGASELSGAQVSVFEGAVEYPFFEDAGVPGRYICSIVTPVRPDTEYGLRVVLPDGGSVTATTRTPHRFDVAEWVILEESSLEVQRRFRTFEEVGEGVFTAPENQVRYLDGLLEARFAPGEDAGRYQVGIRSLDLDSPFVIDADFLDEEDFEDFERNVGSPALEATDGFVRLPWFVIYFAGRHKVSVFSVDRNWFDLVRSSPDVSGGAGPTVGGNAGEGFERPIFHVEGGIGLFGSAAVDSIGFVILPRE